MNNSDGTTNWRGLALACGTLTFALGLQAGKPSPPATPAYATVSLGGLRSSDGAINTTPSDINHLGQIVGATALPGYDSAHYQQAFLLNPRDANGDGKPDTWFVDQVQNATGAPGADGQNDLILGLGTLPTSAPADPRGSFATAVNDSGWVVGTSHVYDPGTQTQTIWPIVVVPNGPNGWYQDANQDGGNDLMVSLGTLPGLPGPSSPNELNLNNRGQVVGWFSSSDAGGVAHYAGFLLSPTEVAPGVWQWFLDDGNGGNQMMLNLGSFLPKSINDGGQIVGMTDQRQAKLRNAAGTLIDLGLPGTQSEAVAINNRGQIAVWFRLDVGHAGLLTPLDTNSDGAPDTWFKDANGDGINDLVVDLGAFKGYENAYVMAQGLNDGGSVVGDCWHAGRDGLGWNRAPFLWQNGVLRTLKSLTGGTVDFWRAYAINNAGQILCEALGTRNTPSLGACILVPNR